jgi:hypothetical protein
MEALTLAQINEWEGANNYMESARVVEPLNSWFADEFMLHASNGFFFSSFTLFYFILFYRFAYHFGLMYMKQNQHDLAIAQLKDTIKLSSPAEPVHQLAEQLLEALSHRSSSNKVVERIVPQPLVTMALEQALDDVRARAIRAEQVSLMYFFCFVLSFGFVDKFSVTCIFIYFFQQFGLHTKI